MKTEIRQLQEGDSDLDFYDYEVAMSAETPADALVLKALAKRLGATLQYGSPRESFAARTNDGVLLTVPVQVDCEPYKETPKQCTTP